MEKHSETDGFTRRTTGILFWEMAANSLNASISTKLDWNLSVPMRFSLKKSRDTTWHISYLASTTISLLLRRDFKLVFYIMWSCMCSGRFGQISMEMGRWENREVRFSRDGLFYYAREWSWLSSRKIIRDFDQFLLGCLAAWLLVQISI